jgi:hypothetical protein
MSSEALGLWISLISLILGVISAWQQIKSFLLKIARFGGNAAKSWLLKEQAVTELYLEQPAALVAYLGKSTVSFFLLFIALLLIRPIALQDLFGISADFARYMSLVPACLIGLLLGAIFNKCSDVVRLASQRKIQQPAS